MRGWIQFGVACALALGTVPAAAQGSYSRFDESASTALARYVRTLTSEPQDFDALIGAGKSALELGDAQAAAGFFARADAVDPRSPLPQAGIAAVAVANGDPQGALPYFKRAQQLGLPLASFACDRGLAYDLLGQQAQAQSDYRLALGGADRDEARRRLALSLAISGNRAAALQTLAPLSAKGDPGIARVRAFVLALTGDSAAAMVAINAAMPGTSAQLAPYLRRLSGLSVGAKAAAVNLGIFPENGAPSYAAPPPSLASAAGRSTANRLADIDSLLRDDPAPARSVQAVYTPSVTPPRVAEFKPKLWLQLASGDDVDALGAKFRRLKAKSPDLFSGLKPYVARNGEGARLIIGPFRKSSDAQIFSEDLESVGIAPMRWTNSQSDRIAPLAVE